MKAFIYILFFAGWCLGATTISTTYNSGSCPVVKHSSCLSTTVSGSYNWKTKRGKITISGKFPVFAADYIIMVGYDADGIELGEIYQFTPDFLCDDETECGGNIFVSSASFTEYNNGLPESLQSDVRSIKLRSNGDTKRISCNAGYIMNDDGICVKSKTSDDEDYYTIKPSKEPKEVIFQPYGSPYPDGGKLPRHCWGSPDGQYWCSWRGGIPSK